MKKERTGNVVLEPLRETVISAAEAKEQMKVLEGLITRPAFDRKSAVTVPCFRNEFMGRDFARELFKLITVDYGVPKARFISPTLEGAGHLFDAAEDLPGGTLIVYTQDQARTGIPCKSLAEYAEALGY
jgi:hypothetical protein